MNVVIFEDEKHNAERLIQLLEKQIPGIRVLGIIETIAEGMEWLMNRPNDADIIFMDIQLSDGNCFEMLDQLQIRSPIIFTTAYDKFALQAFKVHSIDYLLKPIDSSDLERALSKYMHFKAPMQQVVDVGKIAEEFFKKENTRFLSRINNQLVYVKAKDIAYIHFTDGITKVVTMQNQKVPLDHSLDQMEKMLNRVFFYRVNRNLIVHIDAITKISSYYNNRLVLQLTPEFDKDTVISRERVAGFKTWLEGRSTL